MNKSDLPIPIYQLAFLQAYLYEIFSLEGRCEKNFENAEWYLKEKFTDKEVDSILEFFNSFGLKCDCDIIHKLDLREILDDQLKFHN